MKCPVLRGYPLGGLEGALAQRAEEVFTGLPPAAQTMLPSVLRRLITIGAGDENIVTAKREPLASLTTTVESRTLCEAFVQARLLVADRAQSGQAVIGIAHEALLHHWPRLLVWLVANRDFLRAQMRITEAAARWREEGKNIDFLLPQGKPLAEAEELLTRRQEDLDVEVVEYIKASKRYFRQLHKRRVRVITLVIGTFLAVVLGFSTVAEYQRRVAIEERNNAERQKQLALQQKAQTEEAKKHAEANFHQARKTVDDFFTKVSEDKLLDIPGLQPLRRELLTDALTYYQAFLQQRGDDPTIQYELALTYARVADITGEIGSKEDALK
jgi:Novel STAND NTPase 1